MDHPVLQSRAALDQPRRGVYHGVEASLDFGDPIRELTVLRAGCGVFDLSWRAKIAVTGKDRVRWLHNMVSNDVRGLTTNRGAYNFALNAQGRILGDMFIYNRGESFLIDTDRAQVDSLLTSMKRFIIMDKVEMNVADDLVAIGVCGPRSEEVLAGSGTPSQVLELLEIREASGLNGVVIRGPENKPNWFEVWTNPNHADEVRDRLLSVGAQPVGAEALELWRVLHGIPHYGQDIRERDLPQETGQTQALCFTKGCYIGQEIVERIRSRGQVHRAFVGFEFTGAPPSPGKFESEGRTQAEITSIARIPGETGHKALGLGYVRREVAAEGHLDLNGLKARIVALPFTI